MHISEQGIQGIALMEFTSVTETEKGTSKLRMTINRGKCCGVIRKVGWDGPLWLVVVREGLGEI